MNIQNSPKRMAVPEWIVQVQIGENPYKDSMPQLFSHLNHDFGDQAKDISVNKLTSKREKTFGERMVESWLDEIWLKVKKSEDHEKKCRRCGWRHQGQAGSQRKLSHVSYKCTLNLGKYKRSPNCKIQIGPCTTLS